MQIALDCSSANWQTLDSLYFGLYAQNKPSSKCQQTLQLKLAVPLVKSCIRVQIARARELDLVYCIFLEYIQKGSWLRMDTF